MLEIFWYSTLKHILFISLAESGLSCSAQDLLLWCVDSLVMAHGLSSCHEQV